MRQRTFTYSLMILIFLWGIIVLSKYFYVLVNLPWLSLDIKASYGLISLASRGLLLPIIFFILFNLITIIISRVFKKTAAMIIIAGLLMATLLLLCISIDHWLWLKALLFFSAIILMGFGTVFLYRIIFKYSIPYWAGLLLLVILAHYYFFPISLLGVFGFPLVVPFILILSGTGCLELWKNGRDRFQKILSFINSLHWPALLFIEGLYLTLAAGFVAACAPETYSDAMRNHVPFMINVVREGVLAPNYYWFGHLQSSPLQLVAAGGYLFLGEMGAKWFTWFIGMMSGVIIIAEVYHITKKWAYALGTGFLFLSSPYIWIWLTTNYQDIPTATFLLAGLATLRKTFTEKNGYLLPSGIFCGFAFIAKFHAFIIILAMVICFILIFTQPIKLIIKKEFRKLILGIISFVLVVIPWLTLVWHWTGNPVFPIANDFFKSPYISPHFLEEMRSSGKTLFKIPNGWLDVLSWPWSMTFQTKYFGEVPNGGVGPFFLIFYPFILGYIIFCLFHRSTNSASKMAIATFLIGLCFIGALSYEMGIPYIRFWNTGFSFIAIAIGIALSEVIAMNQPYKKWVSVIFAVVLVCLSLGILFAWGVKLNYAAPDGIGWSLYTGKISKDEYLKRRTGNTYLYVNKNINKGECIMAVGYEQLNTFRKFTFQLNIWNDKIIGLNTLKDYEKLVQKGNVRYWVVKDSYKKGYYADTGVAQKYWQDELLVHSQDGFSVYTTKPSSETKQRPLKEVRLESSKDAPSSLEGWKIAGFVVPYEKGQPKGRFDTQIYNDFYPPSKASKITGSIFFRSDQDNGVVLCHIIWYKFNQEIKRIVAEAVSAKDKENELSFSEPKPTEATKVVIIINPWRKEDGTITVERTEIKWWE